MPPPAKVACYKGLKGFIPAVRYAFTLSEVLITLGIIGVVAAMTMPALIANNQKKELHTALKKAYSVMSNAYNRLSYDEGTIVNYDTYGYNNFKPHYIKYFDILLDCKREGCVAKESDDGGFGTKIYRNYNKTNQIDSHLLDNGQFILKDGMLIMMEVDGGKIFITVDVNGYKKKPNVWGQDVFTFEITKNGKFLPMGTEGTTYNAQQYCSKTSTSRLNGIACANLALTDETYWKNLP